MEDCFASDSTYGSLTGMQYSSSSFSMSLSGSDTFEDHPSTSGCSSDMTHKEKRKARVKQYLRQLKAMVPPKSGRRGKMGTLGALQHVIGSLQKIQEDQDKSHFGHCDELISELDNSVFNKDNQLSTKVLKTEDAVQIVLTVNEFKVLKVSENITRVFGYPANSWINRSISHFVHKKDIVTINSSLNVDPEEQVQSTDHEESVVDSRQSEQEKSFQVRRKFFFRIRNYKGLQQSGFSLVRPDRFTTVQASIVASFGQDGSLSDSLPSSPTSGDTERKGRKCIYLECVPLQSLYNVENVQLENQTFYLRHTMYCSYSSMHPNAIPLLGYLPQDMNGMSIFDFYHKDDTETLYNIYREIVASKGATFKSKPIRLRTRNGDWLTVETEWSSFANPWSHRLEFIIGQHKVLKPPADGDVFGESDRPLIMPELSDYQQNLQHEIRQMLLEPVSEKSMPSLQSRINSYNKVTPEDLEKAKKKTKQQTEQQYAERAAEASESLQSTESLRISSRTFPQHETCVAYEQLNYANNIKRYLMSQQKTYSSSSKKKTTSEEETDTPCTISTTTAELSDSEFEVDISVPKPPSFGSSTKVLLSEHEQREDIANSPAHQIEDNTEDGAAFPTVVTHQFTPPAPPMESPDTVRLLTLTQDVLLRHTRRQEDLFVAHAEQERSPIILKSKGGVVLQERKRSHSPDREKGLYIPNKSSRGISSILVPPFPLPDVGYTHYRQSNVAKQVTSPRFTQFYKSRNQSGDQYTLSPSVCITKPSQINMGSKVSPAPGNVIWPYYPQTGSGASFYPQVMGGFYQEPNSTPATRSLNVTSTKSAVNTCSTTMSGTGGHNLQVLQGHCQGPFHLPPVTSCSTSSSDMSIYHTDSGSSYLYLLDSDDQNSSGQEVETKTKITKNNKRQIEPPWLENMCWGKKLAMNYQMPKKKKDRVLDSDKAFLANCEVSSVLLQQMMDLQTDIDFDDGSPPVDEECNYLFYLDEEEEEQSSDSDSKLIPLQDIHESLSRCENHQTGIGCSKDSMKKPQQRPNTALKRSPRLKQLETLEESSDQNMESEKTPLQDDRVSSEQEDRMDCQTSLGSGTAPENLTDVSTQEPVDTQGPLDSLTMDTESNSSKSSSNLTPSEERSSREGESSLKESDAMSSKGSLDEDKDSTESDVDMCSGTKKDSYHPFFVVAPIFFVNHSKTPSWCMDCDVTSIVEMKYTMAAKETEKCLEEDKRRIRNVVQPDLVKKQMGFMIEELKMSLESTEKIGNESNEFVTGGKESGCFVDTCSFKKPMSQQHCRAGQLFTDDVFDNLFVTMFTDDLVASQRENSPDIEDVSHTLEEVD